MGRYSSDLLCGWSPPDGYDEVQVASSLPDHPNVWTDGSLVLDQVTGVSLPPVLGSFLVLLRIAGVAIGGGILMMFVLMVFSVLVGFLLCSWTSTVRSAR